jgi:hypothetical protein
MRTRAETRTAYRRAGARGAAMVEAVCVIAVFILFFLGMTYFRTMYQQKLRIARLARAAAVGYALNGCQGSPLALVQQDLGSGSNGSQSGQQSGSAQGPSGAPNSNPSVGQNTGNPVNSALGSAGMTGDPIAVITLTTPVSASAQSSPLAPAMGFNTTLSNNSYMSCGDVAQAGTAAGAWNYASSLFNVP